MNENDRIVTRPGMSDIDKQHIWHPYSSVIDPAQNIKVTSARGVQLTLDNGKTLIDGMASWWCAIHGYNNEYINNALIDQITRMSHVMFGGITHDPAIELTKRLLKLLHPDFEYVFYCDSGSVSVEIAMKMAIQFYSGGSSVAKNKFLTIQKGYHGDTFAAMSVCDPATGMHKIFNDFIPGNFFAPSPKSKFGENLHKDDFTEMENILKKSSHKIAAIIVEPIVQGAGGMRFYAKEFLVKLKEFSQKYDTLLIFDEIATGFGRTGKLFAYEHANVVPDIICIGKALTGGYLSLAATITSKKVAQGIEKNGNILMHGPTFMANPLACRAASASIDVLLNGSWKENVNRLEKEMKKNLRVCLECNSVVDLRVLGAIAVVELKQNVNMKFAVPRFVELGVWIRPFMNLIYLMPPYIISNLEIKKLTNAIYTVITEMEKQVV